jgi:hypothetical protein
MHVGHDQAGHSQTEYTYSMSQPVRALLNTGYSWKTHCQARHSQTTARQDIKYIARQYVR